MDTAATVVGFIAVVAAATLLKRAIRGYFRRPRDSQEAGKPQDSRKPQGTRKPGKR